MIISHANELIFIHNRKAAGTSIIVSLARHLGPNDLMLSGISETANLGINLTERIMHEARNHAPLITSLSKLFGRSYHARMIGWALDHCYRPLLGRKPPHSPAKKISEVFPDEWKKYKKICVVRNPWDKTVSDYFWRVKSIKNPPTFEEYVKALRDGKSLNGIVPIEYHSNWEMYTIDDRIVVDHVVFYHDLSNGLRHAFKSVGIDWDGWLPKSKSQTRKKIYKNYQQLYNDETKEIIQTIYHNEITAFNFKFE